MSEPSQVFLLRDYLNARRGYNFNPATGSYQVVQFASEKEGWNLHPVGFGAERRVGPAFRTKFLALYPKQDGLLLAIGDKVFDLASNHALAKRDTLFPCFKRFRVIQAGDVLLSLKYVYSDLTEDGGYNVRDFFLLVENLSGNREAMRRFMRFWEEIAKGGCVEFLSDLNARKAQW